MSSNLQGTFGASPITVRETLYSWPTENVARPFSTYVNKYHKLECEAYNINCYYIVFKTRELGLNPEAQFSNFAYA